MTADPATNVPDSGSNWTQRDITIDDLFRLSYHGCHDIKVMVTGGRETLRWVVVDGTRFNLESSDDRTELLNFQRKLEQVVTESSEMTGRCPIGSLGLHTANHERTECIWCGPGKLAWQPGKWIDNGDGTSAWSADLATAVQA